MISKIIFKVQKVVIIITYHAVAMWKKRISCYTESGIHCLKEHQIYIMYHINMVLLDNING